jgi:hypothetical protein
LGAARPVMMTVAGKRASSRASTATTPGSGRAAAASWTMGASVSGDVVPGGQVSLQVSADIRGSETTCPEGLYEGEESWTASYSVELDDEGNSFWYYNGADAFGAGGSTPVAMNFLTEKACTWF